MIPIFTHHGRPIVELSRCCPNCCLPFCNKCQPREQLLSEDSDIEEHESEEFEPDEESDEDQVISFRDMQEGEELGDADEVSVMCPDNIDMLCSNIKNDFPMHPHLS